VVEWLYRLQFRNNNTKTISMTLMSNISTNMIAKEIWFIGLGNGVDNKDYVNDGIKRPGGIE